MQFIDHLPKYTCTRYYDIGAKIYLKYLIWFTTHFICKRELRNAELS